MKIPRPSHSPIECFVHAHSEYKRDRLPGVRMSVAGEWVKCLHHVTQTSYHFKNATIFGHYDLAEAVCRMYAIRNIPVVLTVVKAGNVLMKVRYDKKLLRTLEERAQNSAEIHNERPLVRSLGPCRTPLFGYPDSHVLQREGAAI